MTETRAMPAATGEARQITKWFANGWFNCPWCGAANPADAQHCDNPACWASKYATAENVRAGQDRDAREAAEREQRHQAAAAQAAAQERYQQQRAELWQQRVATATERGACLTCLRASRWETEPLYRRHRRPDFHAATA
nr:hypothetical protein [Micromonospora sp. DSM 115978]